jgi:hypothetical protein
LQLADLAAHTAGLMSLDSLGLLKKVVKDSGYIAATARITAANTMRVRLARHKFSGRPAGSISNASAPSPSM